MFDIFHAKSNPDPWQACHWGVDDHPHYLDCANCEHCFEGTLCDFGAVRFREISLEQQKKECDRMIAEITEFCNTDFMVEDALHVAHKLNADKENDYYDF